MSDLLEAIETTTPSAQATTLFKESFNANIPRFPHHIEVRYIGGTTAETAPIVGYVHITATKDFYLCGGMSIDANACKRLDATHRTRIGAGQAASLKLCCACFHDLSDTPAVFGYCRDVRAMKVDLRAGFVPTQHQYLIVRWQQEISAAAQVQRIAEAPAIGRCSALEMKFLFANV